MKMKMNEALAIVVQYALDQQELIYDERLAVAIFLVEKLICVSADDVEVLEVDPEDLP